MKLKSKMILFGIAVATTILCNFAWHEAAEPYVGANLAVSSLNGGNVEAASTRIFAEHSSKVPLFSVLGLTVFGLLLFMPSYKQTCQCGCLLVLAAGGMLGVGCQPYDTPEYIEVTPSQTAFVIQLEGATGNQDKFKSAEFLEKSKVATKRIQITHRWSQEGRMWTDGRYIGMEKVVLVDRAPQTVEWKAQGSAAQKGKDRAIWTESADSIGFSMGWTCTAFIKEEDTAKFLYMYPSGSLTQVLDTEVRGRVQQAAAQVAAKYKLDELRDKKGEVANGVKEDVVKFFEGRGITITTIGMFGGMEYENPEIQKGIDATFVAQQEKVIAKAKLDAQDDKNKVIKSEAEAMADAAKTKAGGDAAGKLLGYKAEAEGIEAVNTAIAKAAGNTMLVQLKGIEVEKARVEKWDGRFPTTVAGAGADTWVGLAPATSLTAPSKPLTK